MCLQCVPGVWVCGCGVGVAAVAGGRGAAAVHGGVRAAAGGRAAAQCADPARPGEAPGRAPPLPPGRHPACSRRAAALQLRQGGNSTGFFMTEFLVYNGKHSLKKPSTRCIEMVYIYSL